MKALLIALSTLISTSAFAYTPEMLTKVMNNKEVQTVLAGQNIKSITDGPSYRCMGCYALRIETHAYGEDAGALYNVQIMDFAGRFHVSIAKIKTGLADQE